MKGLKGKVAIVTGATKEMGEVVAERLAAEGMRVLGCGRDAARGEACAQRIRESGGRAKFQRVDVGHEAEVAGVVQAAVAEYGRLDIVVNLAAAVDSIRSGNEKRVTEESTEAFQRQLTINALAPFWFFKYAIPEMIRAGGGSFVNVSSLAGAKSVPGMPAYSASKAALEGLSRQVATDYAANNIRSNCIGVGAIRTSQNTHLHDHPVVGPAMRTGQIITRPGNSNDIASMVAFLASEESAFSTGEVFYVDGGSRLKTVVPDISAAYKQMSDTDTAS